MSKRVFEQISTAWRWYAHFAGAAVLSLGVAYLIVSAIAGDKAVIEEANNVRIDTTKVQTGGNLSYTFDMKRNEACPGDVVSTFRQLGTESPVVLTIRRSVSDMAVRQYNGVKRIFSLPEGVGPGRWRFEAGIDSRCPTRQRYDRLLTFNFEVI